MDHWAELPANPKISVITVSFNQGEFIRQNIDSVLQQNYPNFEHIVVDGGSKDNTLDILKSYPHLKWTSEPDRNQCDALNKGFSRATGDIICWLNSDDWLAPEAFQEVVAALRKSPLVLTAAAETDRTGNIKQIVPNTGRTYFDLLRYWIPYAWLAQTGIFFRRSLLEEVKRGPEGYVDEDFYFVMDMDLWLRMAKITPFTNRIDKLCAFFRIYEENKTGKSPLSTQKECSRVFRRFINEQSRTERTLSFIIPVNSVQPEIAHTFQSLMQQSLRDFDILFVDYSTDSQQSLGIARIVQEIEKSVNVIGVRCIQTKGALPLEALNKGILAAKSSLVAAIWPGDVLAQDFVMQAVNSFAVDPTGIMLPVKEQPELKQTLHDERTYRLRHEGLFSEIDIPFNFVARKAVLEEIGGLPSPAIPPLSLRKLVMTAQWKGWHVNTSNEAQVISAHEPLLNQKESLKVFGNFIFADLIVTAASIAANDAFASVREKNYWAPSLPQQTVAAAMSSLSNAPKGWDSLSFAQSVDTLRSSTSTNPEFAPAYYLLAKILEKAGLYDQASQAMKDYETIKIRLP